MPSQHPAKTFRLASNITGAGRRDSNLQSTFQAETIQVYNAQNSLTITFNTLFMEIDVKASAFMTRFRLHG